MIKQLLTKKDRASYQIDHLVINKLAFFNVFNLSNCYHLETGRKLNVHNVQRLLKVLCTFNLRPVS